jgi:hypothetical protein
MLKDKKKYFYIKKLKKKLQLIIYIYIYIHTHVSRWTLKAPPLLDIAHSMMRAR